MTKIKKPNQNERDMFKYSKARPRVLDGKILHKLFDEFGIGGNFAADLAGYYLGYSRQSIHAMMSRTIRTNDYELLHIALTAWKVQRMADESRASKYGPVRADGKRHRRDDFEKRLEEKRDQNSEYMRQVRAQNPQKWRKPK